jgi:hypothetical protein
LTNPGLNAKVNKTKNLQTDEEEERQVWFLKSEPGW